MYNPNQINKKNCNKNEYNNKLKPPMHPAQKNINK